MKFIIVLLFFFYSSSYAKLDTQWWKNTIIYELIPYSFKDSNGDGIGDLKGITSELDHFMDLGIETIHCTPMFKTTFRDIGYDVTDFYDIEPRFGTMEHFEELMSEMNKRGLKLILDWVINHSGAENEWFKKSIDRIDPYTDFYVWKDSKGFDNETQKEIPPNNWYSLFGGSAWKWNEKRKQFYLHQFLEEQVDFNLRNPIVKEELKKMIKFWLDKGVAGFRLDAVLFMMEDEQFRDNGDEWWQCDEEDTYRVIHEFREFLDEYNKKNGGIERIFIAEAHGDITTMQRFYDQDEYHITHFPYNFVLRYISNEIDAANYHYVIMEWMRTLPKNAVSLWVTDDHDGSRTGNRIRPEYMDILTITAMLLPGNAGIYYGQEIGMIGGYITEDQMVDFSGRGSRDPTRLLMQWDNTLNAGFSENISPIVPSNSDYFYRNVEDQKKQKVSHYNLFKNLSSLRKTETFTHGDIQFYIPSKYVFIFTRAYKGRMLAVIINLHALSTEVNLYEAIPLLPKHLSIVAASVNAYYTKGYEVNEDLLHSFVLMPYSSIVMEGSNTDEL